MISSSASSRTRHLAAKTNRYITIKPSQDTGKDRSPISGSPMEWALTLKTKCPQMVGWICQVRSSTRNSSFRINRFNHNFQIRQKIKAHRVCQPKVAYNGQWRHRVNPGIIKHSKILSPNNLTLPTNKRIKTVALQEARRTWSSERTPANRSCLQMEGRSPLKRCQTHCKWSGMRCKICKTTAHSPGRRAPGLPSTTTAIIRETKRKLWKRTSSHRLVRFLHRDRILTHRIKHWYLIRTRTIWVKAKTRRSPRP